MKNIILILSFLMLEASAARAQFSTAAVDIPFTVKCGTSVQQLHFGVDPSATDGMDAALGEYPLPPLPPEGLLDARLMLLNDSDGSLRDFRPGTVKFNGTKTCTLKIKPGTVPQVKILFDLPKHVSLSIREDSGTILPEKSINGKDSLEVSLASAATFHMTVTYELGIVVPGASVLLKPENHSTGINIAPVLSWNTTEWAKVYQLLVSTDEAFTSVAYCDTNLTTAAAQPGSLKHGTKYYWKVRAKNSEGTGPYSNAWSFATSAAVDIPLTVKCAQAKQELFFGLDSSATDGLDADLGEVPLPPLPPSGILDARFMVANDDNGSARDYRKGSVKFVGTASCTLKVTPGASKEVKFIWNLPEHVTIKIKDKSGTILPEKTIKGKDSVSVSIETTTNFYMSVVYELGLLPPVAPVLLTPANGGTGVDINPVLGWNISQGAESYEIILASDEGFSNAVLTESAIVQPAKQAGPLEYNKKYYWKVRGINSAGAGVYSSVWSFTTAPKALTAPGSLSVSANVYKKVTLTWKDNSDNEAGFRILRKDGDAGSTNPFKVLKDLPSNQTGFVDSTVEGGMVYAYLVAAFSEDKMYSYSDTIYVETVTSVKQLDTMPVEYGLLQNYPNPFNPSTTIRFTVKEPSRVRLRIYNQLGEVVAELMNEVLNGGTYEKVWNAGNAPSGYYFYELRAESYLEVKKMLLLK